MVYLQDGQKYMIYKKKIMSYSKVKYITTNRTYFDLGYSGNSNTAMHIVFKPHTGGGGTGRNTYICGKGYTGNRQQLSINCYYNSTSASETLFNIRYYAGSSYNDNFITNCSTEVVYDATLSTTGITVSSDGVVLNSTTYSNTYSPSPLYLFGNGNNNESGVITLYEFQVYDNGVLIHNYVPYKDNTTGYGVVYDTITDTFLSANEPSKVTAGPQAFGPDTDTLTFSSNGDTQTVNIDSDNSWSATTSDSWFSIYPSSGTSGETVTITAAPNVFEYRTGTVTFTDGTDSAVLTVNQEANTYLPLWKIFINGNRVN